MFSNRTSAVSRHILNLRKLCANRTVLKLDGKCDHLLRRGMSHFNRISYEIAQLRNSRFYSTVIIETKKDAKSESPPISTKRVTESMMHRLFEESIHYSNTIAQPINVKQVISDEQAQELLDTDWTDMELNDIVNAYKKLTYHAMNNGKLSMPEEYDDILMALVENMSEINHENALKLLQYTLVLKERIEESTSFKKFITKFEYHCIKMVPKLNISQLLQMSDYFYNLEPAKDFRPNKFMFESTRKLGGKPHKLSAKNLTQLSFYLSIYRNPAINTYELEYRLNECLQDLSTNELGITMLGLFRARARIRNCKLVSDVIDKVLNSMDGVESIYLASIFKTLRLSVFMQLFPRYKELLTAVLPHLPRLSIMCVTQISHLAAKLVHYDKEWMSVIVERFNDELPKLRLKDIERINYAIASVCPDDEFKTTHLNVIQELISTYKTSRHSEMVAFPVELPTILTHLSFKNIYSEELLKFSFSPHYMDKLFIGNLHKLTREFWILDYNVRIDLPSYTGPFLQENYMQYMTKKFFITRKSEWCENKTRQFITEFMHISKVHLNLPVCIDEVLPQYCMPDIIYGLDEANNVISVESILSQMPYGTIKRVSDRDDLKHIKFVAVVIIRPNNVIARTDQINNFTKAKIRHLEKIGYTPLTFWETEWSSFETEESKAKLIKDLVFSKKNLETFSLEQ